MTKDYVIDIIKDKYKEWSIGDNIIINFQTGSRKTTFILRIFAQYLSQINDNAILYLVPRTELKEHIIKEIKKCFVTNVTVMTYQDLENKIFNEDKEINGYRYIVCDECHYFIADSWNRKTEVSWQYILGHDSLKIWMSGTGFRVFQILKNLYNRKELHGNLYEYEGCYDYQYIENIYFFNSKNKFEYIKSVINNVPIGEKAVYFCSIIKDGNKIFKSIKNKDVFFLTSTEKKSNYNKEAKIQNNKFDADILIATSVIDTGISLEDEQITNIITDIYNVETLVQCIGRKRINKGEKIVLHICNYTKEEITKFKKSTDKNLYDAKNFLKSEFEYLYKYEKDRQLPTNPFLYYSVKKNSMLINKLYYTSEYLKSEEFGIQIKHGFDTYLVQKYFKGFEWRKAIYIDEIETKEKMSQFKEYLDKVAGKKLFVEEQIELMKFISELNELKEPKTYKLKSIIKFFNDNKLDYEIKKAKESNRSSDNYNHNYILISENSK